MNNDQKLLCGFVETPRILSSILDEWDQIDPELQEHYIQDLAALFQAICDRFSVPSEVENAKPYSLDVDAFSDVDRTIEALRPLSALMETKMELRLSEYFPQIFVRRAVCIDTSNSFSLAA